MIYLRRGRVQLAAEQVTRCSAKVEAVCAQVVYESEAAFSRAFVRGGSLLRPSFKQGQGRWYDDAGVDRRLHRCPLVAPLFPGSSVHACVVRASLR